MYGKMSHECSGRSDEIIPEWLTAVLREEGAVESSRVTSIQSAPVGQLGFFE